MRHPINIGCLLIILGGFQLMKTQKQMKERLKWYVGRYIDFDKVFLAQCADLAVDYMWWATDGKYRMMGNAIDAINTRANKYGSYATIHKNTTNFLPEVGDIAVWTQAPAHPTYGHIGIVYGDINLNTCTMLDQNWDGDPSKPAKLRTDNYRGITHFIRINFKDEPIPTKPSASTSATGTHTVKKGETLYSISKKYNTTVDELKSLNGLKSNLIQTDQVLKIKDKAPVTSPKKPVVTKLSPANYNTGATRGRSTSAYFKGKVDANDVHIRNRNGSQSKGFNFDVDTRLRLQKNDEVYGFEQHLGWVRIYTGDLTGNGSNRWVWHERIIPTEVYK